MQRREALRSLPDPPPGAGPRRPVLPLFLHWRSAAAASSCMTVQHTYFQQNKRLMSASCTTSVRKRCEQVAFCCAPGWLAERLGKAGGAHTLHELPCTGGFASSRTSSVAYLYSRVVITACKCFRIRSPRRVVIATFQTQTTPSPKPLPRQCKHQSLVTAEEYFQLTNNVKRPYPRRDASETLTRRLHNQRIVLPGTDDF